MLCLGIHHSKIAVLKREKNHLSVIELSSDVKLLDRFKKIITVSGLETTDIARRDLTLKLRREKEVLAVLPFQLEPLIPFPIEETVVFPILYPNNDDSTDVVAFITAESRLSAHLGNVPDPDIVSTVAAALVRFGIFQNPSAKEFYILHEETAAVFSHDRIVFVQSYSSHEEARMESFIHSKWIGFPRIDILSEHAVPIGLALEGLSQDGRCIQFRQGGLISEKSKKKQTAAFYRYLAVTAAFSAAVWSGAFWQNSKKQQQICEIVDNAQGTSSLPLPRRILNWEESLNKNLPSLDIPATPVSTLFAWLSSREEPIEVEKLQYFLEPSFSAKVSLEFTAPSPGVARTFHEALVQGDGPVDPNLEISWALSGDRYLASFFLRRLP